MIFDFIDLTHIKYTSNKEANIIDEKQIKEIYHKTYDERTTDYYKVLRTSKLDPFTNNEVDEKYAFKFYEKWDSITGIKQEKDPFGALYFDPDNLVFHFYTNRLNDLWVEPVDEEDGYYEGYYDMAVGSGEDIEIVGRGACPDKYLFRLPIIDCYVLKEQKSNIITMGPKLTQKEIIEIDKLVKTKNTYFKTFGKNPPDLLKMFNLYNQAINKTPFIGEYNSNITPEALKQLYTKANYNAVNQLQNI
jgi:hypothetical protein